jgi:hypothetical protein
MMGVTPFLQFALALVIPGIDLDGQMTDRARACRQRADQCERAARYDRLPCESEHAATPTIMTQDMKPIARPLTDDAI